MTFILSNDFWSDFGLGDSLTGAFYKKAGAHQRLYSKHMFENEYMRTLQKIADQFDTILHSDGLALYVGAPGDYPRDLGPELAKVDPLEVLSRCRYPWADDQYGWWTKAFKQDPYEGDLVIAKLGSPHDPVELRLTSEGGLYLYAQYGRIDSRRVDRWPRLELLCPRTEWPMDATGVFDPDARLSPRNRVSPELISYIRTYLGE